MVWSAPIILGIDIQTSLTTFFVQGLSATLVIMVSLIVVGMFAPADLGKILAEKLGNKYLGLTLILGLVIGLGLFITSGLVNFLIPGGISGAGIDQDTLIIGVFAVLMIIVILFIVGGSAITGKS